MKTIPGFLILVFTLVTACSDDDKAMLSSRELLIRYDWIIFSVEREINEEIPEPDIVYVVLNFSETSYSGSDHTGEFHELGDWSLENDILTMNDGPSQIIEFTAKKLVYEAPDGSIVTRLPIAEVM